MTGVGQNHTIMNIRVLMPTLVVSVGLAFGAVVQAKEKKHEEENISSSDVPAAVQQAAEAEAKGGKIVRWEKEGENYEAVVEKNGKHWGFTYDANGKKLGKHDESKEKEEHHR
jgi:YD repeat-containing protein